MSKELENLNWLKQIYKVYVERLSKEQLNEDEIESFNSIEKSLKALEIIKDYQVDIGWIIRSENCSKYNLGVGESQSLKKREYDLLREVLL